MKAKIADLINIKEVNAVEILNITVGGFRNITNVHLEFDQITSLVGLNGYGKSNVMDAIDFGFDFIHYPANVRPGLMASKHCIPILYANAGKNFQFEFELKLKSKGKEIFARYGYEFSWKTTKTDAVILNEYLYLKENEKNQRYNSFIVRSYNSAKIRSSATGRCNKSITVEDTDLVLNKLLALDELFYFDTIKQIYSVQYYIEKHLDAGPSFAPSPFVIKGFNELELQGIQSIPRAIFYLKQDYPEKYNFLINAFQQLFPYVEDIKVQEYKLNQDVRTNITEDDPVMFTDSIFSMSIIDEKMIQPVGFEHLSDGTKRIFLMLTFAVIADIKGLSMIAIEEPENSIHPGLLQNYLDILSQLVNKCKIVITSHSPYIIQYLNPHSIYIGLNNESGEASFGRIALNKVNTLLKDAAEYDKSVGDYIFNILSDSDSDEFLKGYLENNEE